MRGDRLLRTSAGRRRERRCVDEQLAFRRWLVEAAHGTHGRQTVGRFPAEVAPGALDPCATEPTFVAREEIESALQTAAEAVAEMGARGLEPDVLIERARLDRLLGDEGRYRGELSEAHRLLIEMGAPVRAEQVAKELGS